LLGKLIAAENTACPHYGPSRKSGCLGVGADRLNKEVKGDVQDLSKEVQKLNGQLQGLDAQVGQGVEFAGRGIFVGLVVSAVGRLMKLLRAI